MESWPEYLRAASNKIENAEYHHKVLEETILTSDQIPVAARANFEALLFAFVAACDQVAEALNIGLGLGLANPNLQDAINATPALTAETLSDLTGWFQEPIASDARRIRRRAAHHHYVKRIEEAGYFVDAPPDGTSYHGSRLLVDYARAVLGHFRKLAQLINDVRSELERLGYPSG